MSDQSVSRRAVLGYAGAGVAAAGISASGPAAPSEAPGTLGRLLAPLGPGSSLADWRVEAVVEPTGGAGSVVLTDRTGRRFQLDVCARDTSASAPVAPAQSEHFQVFVANGGDGATSTHEDHGLCAMALAEIIRSNEAQIDKSAFQPLAQRNDARRHV